MFKIKHLHVKTKKIPQKTRHNLFNIFTVDVVSKGPLAKYLNFFSKNIYHQVAKKQQNSIKKIFY